MQDYSDEAQSVREAVERDEHELQDAFEELKGAVHRPFAIVERISAAPLPWIFGAFLIGIWLGSMHNSRSDNGLS